MGCAQNAQVILQLRAAIFVCLHIFADDVANVNRKICYSSDLFSGRLQCYDVIDHV